LETTWYIAVVNSLEKKRLLQYGLIAEVRTVFLGIIKIILAIYLSDHVYCKYENN